MGRGISSGGGQSSLGYLFGSDEAPKSFEKPAPVQKPTPPSSAERLKDIAAGIQSSKSNNYKRSEGQNCGNFLTLWDAAGPSVDQGASSSRWRLFTRLSF
ncbi:Nitrilase-associated protein [Zea mays]|uniref:Nitrilase-associated protein n=1 Tax=Zea mays TaxID=4577 RepID=A0A1D6IV92_MAIZE|nr:Nitrilase-associated protein [Zea mays]